VAGLLSPATSALKQRLVLHCVLSPAQSIGVSAPQVSSPSVITTSTYGRQSISASSSGWTPAVFESV